MHVRARRIATSIAAGVLLAVGSTGTAYADWVSNDLDSTVDASVETLSLTAGGEATVKLWVQNQNRQQGDTLNPCNLNGSSFLVVDVASSTPGVAAVSPATATIQECDLANGVSIEVAALTAGESTITVSRGAGTDANGTFDFAPATFEVTVAAPPVNSPPEVRVLGAEDGGVYELGGFSPDPACVVRDAEDGAGIPFEVEGVVVDERNELGLGTVSVSCSYTDTGGLTDNDQATYTVVDTIAPTMQRLSLQPAANAAGWNNTPVTATWGCFDAGSDVVATEVTATTEGEGTDLPLTGTCRDQAGNTTSDTLEGAEGVDVDLTAPVIEIGRSPAANPAGWNQGEVTVTWTCEDSLSGVVDGGGSVVLGEDDGSTASGECEDLAGNTSSAGLSGIQVDSTPPVIELLSRTAPYDELGWNNGAVTVVWTCSDARSGVVSPGVSPVVSTPGAGQTGQGTCEDLAGNTATATEPGINIDLTAPSIDMVRDPEANPQGWSGSPVTVSWTCSDAGGAGVLSTAGSTTVGEGANQSVTRTCTDHAGNAVDGLVDDIDVDLTPPSIAISRAPAAGNANGWNDEPVVVSWTCEDTLSGVTDDGGSVTLGEGEGQSVTGTCTDRAGHTASDDVTGVNVDTTAPTVSWIEPIGDGAQFSFGAVSPVPGCTASDSLSGLSGTCSVTGYSTAVGTHTLTATAVDRAGNTRSLTSTYEVKPWTTGGYYKPVDLGGVWNTVKNGSTVPLKFEVFAAGTELTSTTALGATFTVKGITCPNGSATMDEVELTTTGGTTFRYDATAGQFVQNWQTPKKPGACYDVTTALADGSLLSAKFLLK